MALGDILQYLQGQEALEERKVARQQDLALSMMQLEMSQGRFEAEQEYKRSTIFLEHNLNELERLNTELSTLRNESTKLGLVGDQLTNQPEGASSGVRDVYNTSVETLDADITSLQGQIKKEKTDQRHYFAGINYARIMDEDVSGSVSDTEFQSFMDTEIYPEEVKYSDAFYYGVQSYTLTPERRLQLEAAKTEDELKRLAIETEQEKLKRLPTSLKLDEELKQQRLDTGELQYSIYSEQVKQAEFATKAAETEISMLKLQKQSAELVFEKAQYEFAPALRAQHIKAIDEMLINNIQAQSGIGAGLLAGMSLELSDKVYTPMFSVLAGSVEEDYLSKISDADALNYIAEDIQKLYSAYGLGKTEDQVPDYTFVLDQVEDIVELKSLHSNFIAEFNDELEITAKEMDRGKYSIEVLQSVAMTKDPDKYDLKKLIKAVQWNNTGIYDNMKVLDQALKAKQQYQDLNSMQEQARGLDVSYTAQEYGVHRKTMEEKLIPFTMRTDYLAPIDTYSPEIDSTIIDIFEEAGFK